jgi:hypothetical protein
MKNSQSNRRTSPQRWGAGASELLRLEESGAWRKTHGSLSFYIGDLARKENKTKSLFWRLLAAGREYNALRAKLDPEGRVFPPLESPDIKASPESLELVNKISRVAPSSIAETVQKKAMSGEISRRELRNLWLAYRPVLGGQTARGRVDAPRYDENDISMRRALREANSLALISKGGPRWLGVDTAYLYKVVYISSDAQLQSLYPAVPDAVVLFEETERSPLELHGVVAGYMVGNNPVIQRYLDDGTSVDYLWFVTPRNLSAQEIAKIPEDIGILHADQDTIQVIRRCSEEEVRSTSLDREELFRALLREASH